MKTAFTLSVLTLLFSFSAFATLRTVSNDPNNPAQYNSVQAAINAANAGDTIYVEATYVTIQNGSVTNGGSNYGNITINKRITLLGSGYNPNQDIAYVSTLGTVTLDTSVAAVGVPASGASYAIVSGFLITGQVTLSGYTTGVILNNFTLERCWVQGDILIGYSNNTIIQQCVTSSSILVGDNTNLTIRNNIINASILPTYYGPSPINFSITNNVFIGSVTTVNTAAYSAFTNYGPLLNAIITNNIFYAVDPTGASGCTFNNNITFANANPTVPYGTNTGSGNFVNTNPTFTNYPIGSANFSPTYNFQLASGSPGSGKGTDGTDIGIYGGIGFVPTGAPSVPYIEHFVINNSSISAGQSLNISIEAKAQK